MTVTAGGDAEALAHLRLFPAGAVRGRLETTQSDPTQVELEVRFQPAPGQKKSAAMPPESAEPCSLAEGAFRCALPAGRLDLRFRVPGFAAVYRWDANVPPGGALELGSVRLHPGASVVGWVEAEDGRAPAAPARLRLARQHPRQGLSPEAEKRLAAMSFEARSNERGFFQFQGVPPGLYSVSAELEGMADATAEGVDVRPGLEAEIVGALVLARPVRFEAEIAPPHDPYGQPWQIAMSRHDAEGFPIGEQVEGVASLDGRFARGGLAPGLYAVRVRMADGSQWFSDDVPVGALEPPLSIRIPILEVEGTVRLGDDPLAATLWFGGRNGTQRVRFDTDLKGRFQGSLPREGKWPVDLTADDPSLRQSAPPVVVERPEGGGPARVEIVLPDTLLAGEVVDEAGRLLPGASVRVSSGRDQRTEVGTDERGAFSLRGLPVGSHGVRAMAGERSTGWLRVQVVEGPESPRLRLVAARVLEVAGSVVSSAGGVPGAQVLAWPDLGPTGVSTGVEAVTDPLGRFQLSLPAETRTLNLLVLPPGNSLRMFQVPIERGRPLEIAVAPSGAALVLELHPRRRRTPILHS
ncbi:MAG TPA: carboxypeptidase-like regulatory domain-containing protein [Thermoanaerobaculia bacterium]|nr:carboxypeptidase-like regulatory domain-containing protein [Thermoanaerobaculia bacterium]